MLERWRLGWVRLRAVGIVVQIDAAAYREHLIAGILAPVAQFSTGAPAASAARNPEVTPRTSTVLSWELKPLVTTGCSHSQFSVWPHNL